MTDTEKADTIRRYALQRYDTDPEFHARAHMAADLVLGLAPEADHKDEMVRRVVTFAAAVGLAMEWVDPATGELHADERGATT